MFDFMMIKAQLALREEMRDLVKRVPRQMILKWTRNRRPRRKERCMNDQLAMC